MLTTTVEMLTATVEEPSHNLPVAHEVDVLVCGGGPAGVAAALSAARLGARTALVEAAAGFGGQGTTGMICYFAPGWHDGTRPIIGGVWDEIRAALDRRGAIFASTSWSPYDPDTYRVILFEILEQAGVVFETHSFVSGAIVSPDGIEAAVLDGKSGRRAIRAKVFIDATGDGDLGARSGAPFELGRTSDGLMQPPTLMYAVGGVEVDAVWNAYPSSRKVLPDGREFLALSGLREVIAQARDDGAFTIPRDSIPAIFQIPNKPGAFAVNLGRVQGVDATNVDDLTRAEIQGRQQADEAIRFMRQYLTGFEHAHLLFTAPQVGVREGRRLRGRYWITEKDIRSGAQFDDVIAQGCYGIDIHSPDTLATALSQLPEGEHYDIPYRALLPLEPCNLLAAGRTISASHEAMSAFRVQPICMAIGQAAGAAAALAADNGRKPHEIDPIMLQKTLTRLDMILS